MRIAWPGGQYRHSEVLAAREKVEQAARRFGRKLFAVAAGGSPQEQWERGYSFINVGGDVRSLGEAFRASVAVGVKPPGASLY
jgi:hypothetical protein